MKEERKNRVMSKEKESVNEERKKERSTIEENT